MKPESRIQALFRGNIGVRSVACIEPSLSQSERQWPDAHCVSLCKPRLTAKERGRWCRCRDVDVGRERGVL